MQQQPACVFLKKPLSPSNYCASGDVMQAPPAVDGKSGKKEKMGEIASGVWRFSWVFPSTGTVRSH